MPKKAQPTKAVVPATLVQRRIHNVRNDNVMLDSDLAELYPVETSNLNKAVKRNLDRFPGDFMFHLTTKEWDSLLFQTGIANAGRGGRRTAPYAFTEQGVAMLSSVLNSQRAVQVNIVIVRTFVKLREIMGTHKELAHKVEALERKYKNHDDELKAVFNAIKKLLAPPPAPGKRKIGFRAAENTSV